MPSSPLGPRDLAADHNHRLTRRLVLVALAITGLVVIPMLALVVTGWNEMMEADDDPLAGLGLVIAVLVSTPVLVGSLVSAAGLIWSRRSAGPVIAGIGLGINVMVVLFVVWIALPGLLV